MSDKQIWPPPPASSDPGKVHDDFLSNLIRTGASNQPISRNALAAELQRVSRMSIQECNSTVFEFCDRNGILPALPVLRRWLIVGPAIVITAATTQGLLEVDRLFQLYGAAVSPTAKNALMGQIMGVLEVNLVVAILGVTAIVFFKMKNMALLAHQSTEAKDRLSRTQV